MKSVRIAGLVILALIAGILLPWVAVAFYGYIAEAMAAAHIVAKPGSLNEALVLFVVFATPSFITGAAAARVLPRHKLIGATALGLVAAAVFSFQLSYAGFSFPGLLLTPAPIALLVGAVAGAAVLSRARNVVSQETPIK